MFRFIERIFNLIGNFFNELISDAEWNRPETVLEDAITKKKRNLEKFFEAVATLDMLKSDQVKSLKNKQIQLERLEVQIINAAKTGDRSKGVALMMKKNQLAKSIEKEVSTVNQRIDEIVNAKNKIKAAQEDIRSLEAKKHEIVAEIKMLQAEKKVDQIQARLFGNDPFKSLDNLTKKIEVEKTKRDMVLELNDPVYTDDVDYNEAESQYDKIFGDKYKTPIEIGFAGNEKMPVYEARKTANES